jgi:hypothetical protein
MAFYVKKLRCCGGFVKKKSSPLKTRINNAQLNLA